MKNVTPFITKIAAFTGISLGAFALAAIAASTWSPPNGPASQANTNVDAPINVGAPTPPQEKAGGLWIKGPFTLTDPLFKFKPSAAPVTPGQVLTAIDNLGTVGWGNASGGSSAPQAIKVFTSTGTWVAPAGVTRIRAKVWGGGGGGGGYHDSASHVGGGGAGGGFAEGLLSVTPGSTYTITVGAGGAGGDSSVTGNNAGRCGSPGGTSRISLGSVLIEAHGGGGGESACGGGGQYSGTAGGSYNVYGNVNAFGISGGDGAAGTTGQAEGGNGAMGGQGTSKSGSSAPSAPGGGGGGGISSPSTNRDGFGGARGMVVLEY